MKTLVRKITYGFAFLVFIYFLLDIAACTKDEENSPVNEGQHILNANTQSNATQVFISNEKIAFDSTVLIPCANGGVGEYVALSGFLHALSTTTINGNNVRMKLHFQPQGIKGIGLITGDQYQGTGATQDEFKGSLVNGQYEETFINNFRIIGQGNGNNYLLHETFHVTINANGVTTVLIDKIESDCK
jgi:hypothetical protein